MIFPQVVCVAGTVLTISFILVLKPTHDAHTTDRTLRLAMCDGWHINPETGGSWPISPSRQVEDVDGQVVEELGSGDHQIQDPGGGGAEAQARTPNSRSITATSPHTPLVVKVYD